MSTIKKRRGYLKHRVDWWRKQLDRGYAVILCDALVAQRPVPDDLKIKLELF